MYTYSVCVTSGGRLVLLVLLLRRHSNVLWFHVAEVGFLPLTHEVKMQLAVTEGAGGCGWGVELESCLLPHLHQCIWERRKCNK